MKVVDPHVHLWDTYRVSYPWLENPTLAYSGDNRLLPKRYAVAQLLQEAGEIACDHIHRESRQHVRRPQRYAGLARKARAARPNTTLKLSGFAMFDHHWTVESFRPYVLEAIDAFGSGRCMFAPNFPIDRLHPTYNTLWSAYTDIVSRELDALSRSNVAHHYRLRRREAKEAL